MAEHEIEHQAPAALAHLRVVELGDVPAAYAGRLLGDLGADVIKVEPPEGAPERRLPPFAGGVAGVERSLTFLHANTNKRSLVLDISAAGDRDTFTKLLLSADVFIEATPVGRLEEWGFTDAWLEANHPGLVTVSLTPFGRTGRYRHYKSSDAITNGAGGFLYSQGDDQRGPCTAPSHSAYQVAGCVAATLALAGVRHRRRCGVGQRLDVSLQEALSFTNSSSIARYTLENRMGRRPGAKTYGGAVTNIYRCKDGRYVHFTANLPHMWRELTQNWMPGTILSEPQWEDTAYRDARSDEASAVVAEFISGFTADEFVTEAQGRHLSAAPLNTVGQFVEGEQLAARPRLQEIEHPVIGRYRAPGFPMRLSGTPMRVRRPAPLLDQHREEVLAELEQGRESDAVRAELSDQAQDREAVRAEPFGKAQDREPVRPERSEAQPSEVEGRKPEAAWPAEPSDPMLSGLRMADLTQQFAGPLGTEILGYYGAEVLKVESNTVAARGRLTAVHADMNRAKLGVTLNLRHDQGKELFRRLVERSQVVVENFSVGVMERLGFDYESLRQINPGIIQVSMPGWGREGPLKSWVAWGWQLLAYTGLMRLWGYPESPMRARCKIAWPDRVGAITMTLGVIAAVEHQERTGEGQFIEASMLEAQGAMLGPAILDYTVNGNEWDTLGYREILGDPYAPYGCYPCAGNDDWIIIACETDEEWQAMVEVIGAGSWAEDARFATKEGRRHHRDELDEKLTGWTRTQTARQAFRRLQQAGVAAGNPMSGEDLYYDLHLRERGHIVEIDEPPWGRVAHHGLPGIPSRSKASAALPAPWIGAHNAYVLGEVLGLSKEEIGALEEAEAVK
ncbi:MAG: CoA transferase [Deltaproteobacteria bacterium]|nr:CoA transferase [Deltaproteobacteria bacterium]